MARQFEQRTDATEQPANFRSYRWPLTVLLFIAAGSFVAFFSWSVRQTLKPQDVSVRAWEVGPKGLRELLPLPTVVNEGGYYIKLPTRERLQHVQVDVNGTLVDVVVTHLLPSELPTKHGSYRPSDYVLEEAIDLGDLTIEIPVD